MRGFASAVVAGAIGAVWITGIWFFFGRWILWNVRCRRGRRCANLVVNELGGDPPPGSVVMMDYTCAGCGTRYQASVLIGEDGSYTQAEKERVG